MKRRMISLLLALSLCAVPVLAEETVGAQEIPAEAAVPAGETTAEETPEETAGETGEAETPALPDPAGPDGELPEGAVIVPDKAGTLSFENLERRIRENNLNVLTIQESVNALEELDYADLADTIRKNMNSTARAMWGYTSGSMEVYVPEYGMSVDIPMEWDSYEHAQLEGIYNSLHDQFDAIQDGEMQKDNAGVLRQLRNLQDQIVMGGETLYLTLADLEDQETALLRQRAALDRTAAEMRLRYEMGQISALQLQQVESGRAALESGIRTLQMNILQLKYQLEVMAGAELTGEVTLGAVPSVTAEQLAAMDMEKDLAAAKEASYEVYAAEKAYEDAEETYDEIWKRTRSDDLEYKQAVHDRAAAKYTYNAAMTDYELRFRKLYHQVQDYAQVLSAAETALEYEKGVYAVSELKFAQGTISANALKSAEDTLKTAEEKAAAAAGDLFASYNTYCWAVKHGILN